METGCASSGRGVDSLKAIQINVGWKMEAYRQANIFRQVTQNQQQQVTQAYDSYQRAFQEAQSASNGNLDVPAPPSVVSAANQLLAVLGAL
ncbi:MAG TPA: hypothetical protein PLX89_19080 [Verrucomicrobiota bacterium]|nr:hypothetical protein [Verrucomicrobiales bacterium]HRI15105.1 hypothetical protein [Verrucomicrobiota bacterium]